MSYEDGEFVKKIYKNKFVEDRRYTEQTEVDVNENKEVYVVDYDDSPRTSEDLDDFEFANYALLRKWRHKRCSELDTEPYKIFQNKTLCIIIRKRRNNNSWGRKKQTGDANNSDLEVSQEDIADITTDLLECWGVGPIKVTEFYLDMYMQISIHTLL